tara:strand:- start:1 stop:576 length:576 start_codon:yes stop_codon:yes gene_type:complete
MANGTLKVSNIQTSSGSGTITLGQSGETVDFSNGSITLNSSMQSTPSFFAFLSSDSSVVSDATWTKVQINSELFDTDNCYDNSSNYRFTPTTAGKYKVEYGITFNPFATDDVSEALLGVYKNGSLFIQPGMAFGSHPITSVSITGSQIIDFNGSSDYIELYGYFNEVSAGGAKFNSYKRSCYLGASRLIGV